MKTFKFLLASVLLGSSLVVMAQTDFTSRITNPSFESNFTGWTYSSMQTQTNSIFDIKAGTVYLEKWTGKGGAVGSCSVSQAITRLQPGNYELTVAAQNIQEDTPNAAQTGAYIFAGDQQTTVTVRNNYKVAFDFVAGSVEIGFKAVNASGNWIAVDNFRLVKVGDDLSTPLASAITQAQTMLGDGTGLQAEQLQQAISDAETVAANTEATAQQQADAIVALQEAEGVYQRANASEDHPLDLTSLIINPSFETADFTGWTMQSMALQTNNVFNIKQGTFYAEKWVNKGNAVGNASLSQTLTDMAPGRYRLHVAAQNIQEDYPTRAQTGASIFANTHTQAVSTRQDYTVEFVLTGSRMEIGFKADNASGNWLSIDNFRLEYISDNADDILAAFNSLIEYATTLSNKRMNTKAKAALTSAIDAANQALATGTKPADWIAASDQLQAAIPAAEASIASFQLLSDAIATAQAEINAASGKETADYEAAVAEAQSVYDNASTTDAQALAAVAALDKAAFAFKIANGTGAAPTVTTDSRFIKGSRWAFGRSTVTGSNILEEGFCWSESPDPKVTDNRTTEFINQAGKIYWLRDLKPGTMYYMRAYAITKNYAVGYGDVIKFSTVPASAIGHWYNNGGDEATNDRINYAINTAMDYYWGNLTSIHDFGISVTYSPGTPTADCSYGGSMRVGANASYQQPGTIMHEALHGIGVGTHGIWWSADMRANGDRGVWLGDRVTEAVRFWDNNSTGTITGDHMHLWPYGCNGANEDKHSDNLYCMMGILAQALNEDGLPGSDAIGYALPYYSFNHEDGVKYYIKNEDENHGLRTSYLVENDSHRLVWKEMSAAQAAADDAAAWYLSFTPGNQYYQLRNAKTGYYMTYITTGTNGIRTINRTGAPQANDNFHLMRGRVDVTSEDFTHRGYYIIHPQSYTATPAVLSAGSNGVTTTENFNLAYAATTQRWLILTAEEANLFDTGGSEEVRSELLDLLAAIRRMAATPHIETVADADVTLESELQSIEAQAEASTAAGELKSLMDSARDAAKNFLAGVSAQSLDQPFDITCLLVNPTLEENADGWDAGEGYACSEGSVEYYEKTFEFYQVLTNMPAGSYEMHVQAFQRLGEVANIYEPWAAGTDKITTNMVIMTTRRPIKNICADASSSILYSGTEFETDKAIADDLYVPNCMKGAALHFAEGSYENSMDYKLTTRRNIRIGLACTRAGSANWVIFRNFRLFYYGDKEVITGIDELQGAKSDGQSLMDNVQNEPIYDLSGRRVTTPQKGLYIVGGRKVFIK
jgi:hypothetical protein